MTKTARILYTLTLLASTSSVMAQPQTSATPMEQALRFKLNNEMEASVQCNAAIVNGQQTLTSMQQDLMKAQARVAELEAKLKDAEPK